MPKKRPVRLPKLQGATPRSSEYAWHAAPVPEKCPSEADHHEADLDLHSTRIFSCQLLSDSENIDWGKGRSAISLDDARSFSDFLERAGLQLPRPEPGAEEGEAHGDWVAQSPEAVLHDALDLVQRRNPRARGLEFRRESKEKGGGMALVQKEAERCSKAGHHVDLDAPQAWDLEDLGGHITMPDYRVRTVDGRLGRRVASQLLEEDELQPRREASPAPRKPSSKQRRFQNPWYMPPGSWYSGAGDTSSSRGSVFTYERKELGIEGLAHPSAGQDAAPEDFKQYHSRRAKIQDMMP